MKPVRIVIFAKAPLPGFAKTRLVATLGAQGAAELAHQLMQQMLEQALAARLGPVELCATPSASDPVWQTFDLPTGLQLTDQGEGDLGERMARAARRVLAGGESILLVGTDCPALGAAQLQQAAAALQHADAALIPAFDGGYVLLGLNRFDSAVFSNMVWSTDNVASETLRRLQQLAWKVHKLAPLHDIDEPDDLRWLAAQ